MKENESGYQDLPAFTMRSRNPLKFILLFVILFLLVVGALAGLFFLGYSKKDAKMVVSTSIPTPTITQREAPLPTSSASAMVTVGAGVDRETKLDRGALTVAVLNGSGEMGAAGGVSTYLKDLGYQIVRVGNADVFTYRNLTVVAKSSKSSYATLLKKDLQANPSFASVSASINDGISADVEVIVGK